MRIPPVCPEVPVSALATAAAYYRDRFGFTIDWADEVLGLAGVSRGETRLFLAAAGYRATLGNHAPIVLWLNLCDRDEVDALYAEWSASGAKITAPPCAKPYKLYEFFARDIDANVLRVFYDFAWEEKST